MQRDLDRWRADVLARHCLRCHQRPRVLGHDLCQDCRQRRRDLASKYVKDRRQDQAVRKGR